MKSVLCLLIVSLSIMMATSLCYKDGSLGKACHSTVKQFYNTQVFNTTKGWKISSSRIQKQEFIQDITGNVFDCTSKILPRDYCQNLCWNKVGASPCSGDAGYCKNKTCVPADMAECHCVTGKLRNRNYVLVDDELIEFFSAKPATVSLGPTVDDYVPSQDLQISNIQQASSQKVSKIRVLKDDRKQDNKNYSGRKLLSVVNIEEDELPTVRVRRDKNDLFMTCSKACFLKARKGKWQWTGYADTFTETKIPKEETITSGDLTVELMHESNVIQVTKIFISGQTSCPEYSNVWAANRPEFFHCARPIDQMWSIIAYVILGILGLSILVCLMITIFKVCRATADSKYGIWMLEKIGRVKTKEKEDESTANVTVVNTVIPISEDKIDYGHITRKTREEILRDANKVRSERTYSKRDPRQPFSNKTVQLTIFMCLIGLSRACDQEYHEIIDPKSCTDDGSNLECLLNLNIDFDFVDLDSQVCINLIDSSNHTWSVLKLNIEQLIASSQLTRLYYTSSWIGFGCQANYCTQEATTAQCSSCANQNPNQNICTGDNFWWQYGHIELSGNDFWNNPGKTMCVPCDGEACSWCYFPQAQCRKFRWVLMPIGTIYAVSVPGPFHYIPVLSISLSDGRNEEVIFESGKWTTTQDLIINSKFGALKLMATSTVLPVDFVFLHKILTTTSGSAYIASANDLNTFTRSNIGDIQAESYYNLRAPLGQQVFKFDPSLVSLANTQSSGTSFMFPAPGIKNQIDGYELTDCDIFGDDHCTGWSDLELPVQSTMSLPGIYLGSYYWIEGNMIRTYLNEIRPFRVKLSAPNSIKFSRPSTKVCPTFQILNVTGCSNCMQGSVAVISAYSQCTEGVVSVSLTSKQGDVALYDTSILLQADSQNFNLHFTTSNVINDIEICMFWRLPNRSCQRASLIALGGTPKNENTTTTDTVIIESSASMDNLGDFFKNIFTGTWYNILWRTIVIILIPCALAGLGYMLYRLILYCKAKRAPKLV